MTRNDSEIDRKVLYLSKMMSHFYRSADDECLQVLLTLRLVSVVFIP